MRFRPTVVLFIFAAIGLGYFFLVEQPRHRRRGVAEEREQRLTMVAPDRVFGLEIAGPDAAMRFVRSDGEWRLTDPVADRADNGSVNTLIHTAANAKVDERFPADASRLSEFGLGTGATTIRFSDSLQANLLSLSIGDFSLTKAHCYAREEGSEEVLVVPAGLRRYALRGLFEYRDKRVADFEVDDVTDLDIASDGHRMSWHKSSDRGWMTQQAGDTIRGDSGALDAILHELRALRTKEILSDDAEHRTRHFSDPAGSLVIRAGDSTTAFTFSRRDGDRCYVRVEGRSRIDGIEASALDVFGRSLEDLRDRHLLRFDPKSLAKVAIETEKTDVSIVRLGEEWSFANPTLGDIDQAEVTQFVSILQDMKFREIVKQLLHDGRARELDTPVFRLVLEDSVGRILDELQSGPIQSGRLCFATSRSSRLLGMVDAEYFETLDSLFADFTVR